VVGSVEQTAAAGNLGLTGRCHDIFTWGGIIRLRWFIGVKILNGGVLQ
jgi:hypothetical protein